MFGFNRFALLSPEGDAGGGAAEGESSEEGGSGEGQQPKDGEFVPRTQLIAALNNAEQKRERELATLRAEFEAKLAKATEKPAETPKRYSRADLLAAVANQQITQEQADTEWERQIREDALATATQAAREIVTTAKQTETVTSQIDQYKALEPEIMAQGSEIRDRIQQEYTYLLGLGDKHCEATQLKAIRAVLGPVEKLKAAKSGRTSHEGHRETGGGGGAGPKGGQGNLKLSAKERTHYEGKVGPGKLYKDWKAVEDELKFARPETRQRHGAPV
jgi:hypothetical protein